MTLPAPTYDLVLLLDPQAEQAARVKILADTQGAIEAQGEFLRHDEWGDRTLTYPIDRKADAEYHLLQFHAGAPELLSALDRTLRITDGVLRFRIIKLKPGVPDAPAMPAAPAAEQPTEPTQSTEPTEPTQSTEPTEPTQSTEPTEPTQSTEPTEPTQSTEPEAVVEDRTYVAPDFGADAGAEAETEVGEPA
jgi:small subunit ribosomal protein S6